MDTTYKAITLVVLLSALVVFGRVAAIEGVSAGSQAKAVEVIDNL